MGFFSNVMGNAGEASKRQFRQDMARTGRQVGHNISCAVGGALQDAIGGLTGIDLSNGPNYCNYGNHHHGYGGYRGEPRYDVRPRDGMDSPFAEYAARNQNPKSRHSVDEIIQVQETYERNLAETQAKYYEKLAQLSGGVSSAKSDPAVTTTVINKPPEIETQDLKTDTTPSNAPVHTALQATAINLKEEQREAYLKVLGYKSGKIDGKEQSGDRYALQKFVDEHKLEGKSQGEIDRAILQEIEKSPAAQNLLDRASKNAKGLNIEERKKVQWILKGLEGAEMPKSEHNGRMDGKFGTETRNLLQQHQNHKGRVLAENESPTAEDLTINAGLDPSNFIGMRGNSIASLSNVPNVAPQITLPNNIDPQYRPNNGGGMGGMS